MNCYDCALNGNTTPAVAVCNDCGAGICLDCVRVEQTDHTHSSSPGVPTPHRTRTLTCASCDLVMHNAS